MSYEIKNPLLPGFYPDPSIVRVEDDFLYGDLILFLLSRSSGFSQPRFGTLGADRACAGSADPASFGSGLDIGRYFRPYDPVS